MDELTTAFVSLWAVIDPIGTVPVFIAVTARHEASERNGIAIRAVGTAALILIGFVALGQVVLEAMSVPLPAFQTAGGIVLFLFSLNMIFGESKPEEEMEMLKSGEETAVFPLAIPSIASPGAMMAVVMLTDNHRFELTSQAVTTAAMLSVLAVQLVLLLAAGRIHKFLGNAGASVVSRVMGLVLASVAANAVLAGIRAYFELS